jgi:oligopeptide/dipeptide ABC transporter ATP-binding protein
MPTLRANARTETAEPLLDVRDLRTGFLTPAGEVKAVEGVSFTLNRGRTLGVVGESGSGKTVLSRSIMRLLPKGTAVSTGQIYFNGTDIMLLPLKRMREMWGPEMAMIFQDPMTSLNPVMKVGKQIMEGLRVHLGMSKNDARENALALMREVAIPEPEKRLDEFPHELSGGMRQRVVIATALACGPRLLFADEPTTALDVTVQGQILDLLGRERADRNMAMILVTHDLGVVAGRTDEIAVMYAGRIVEKAPTWSLFRNKKMPYTEALVNSIPKIDYPSHTRLEVIPGRPPNLLNPPVGCKFAPRCKYVRDKCLDEEPPLIEASTPGHVYRCWFPVGSAEPTVHIDENGHTHDEDPIPVSVEASS